MKTKNIIVWISRLIASGILFQTLFFKFTAHPDSILIFSSLGVEPYGRIILGVIELIVGITILIPKYSWKGAIASLGLMFGAITAHIFVLGINFNNDGGALFILAIVVFIASSTNAYLNKEEIRKIIKKY